MKSANNVVCFLYPNSSTFIPTAIQQSTTCRPLLWLRIDEEIDENLILKRYIKKLFLSRLRAQFGSFFAHLAEKTEKFISRRFFKSISFGHRQFNIYTKNTGQRQVDTNFFGYRCLLSYDEQSEIVCVVQIINQGLVVKKLHNWEKR